MPDSLEGPGMVFSLRGIQARGSPSARVDTETLRTITRAGLGVYSNSDPSVSVCACWATISTLYIQVPIVSTVHLQLFTTALRLLLSSCLVISCGLLAMEESLVARRPKRSTAGNRMEAALAEFKAEDLGMDVEEDADFAIDKGMRAVTESLTEFHHRASEQRRMTSLSLTSSLPMKKARRRMSMQQRKSSSVKKNPVLARYNIPPSSSLLLCSVTV